MTTMTLDNDMVRVRFTAAEKIAGLVRDHDFPVAAVTSARVAPDGLAAVRGMRAPGLALPGFRRIGTWRGRRTSAGGAGRSLVSVRRDEPAVVVELTGQRFDRLVVTPAGADAATLVAELGART